MKKKNSQRFQGRLIPKHLLAISHLILLPGFSHALDALFSFCLLPTWEMLLIYIFFYASLIYILKKKAFRCLTLNAQFL